MLNPEQEIVANHIEGPMLCVAIPGSGKTQTLVQRIIHMVKDNIVLDHQILAMTFTNKAANEMRQRVMDKLGKGIDCVMTTFHSFCVRVLRQYIHLLPGYKGNFTIYDDADQKSVIKTIVGMFSDENDTSKEVFPIDDFLYGMISHIESMTSEDEYLENLSVKETKVYHKYKEVLVENNAVDFTHILSLVVDIFEKHPKVLESFQDRFKYIMIDEAQDTNYIQYVLTNQLAKKHKNILMVGDFNQSIYGFRNANPANIELFKKDYNPKIVRLKQNYRSTKKILSLAKKIIQNNYGNDQLELFTDNGHGNDISIHVGQNPADEADYVINSIIENAEFYDRKWRDYAIIYRMNNLAREFETRLRLASIPYKIYGGHSFYDRKEIKDFLGYLTFLNNSDDFGSFYRIANTPSRGLGPKAIEKFVKFAKDNKLNVHDAVIRASEAGLAKKAEEGCLELSNVINIFKTEPDIVMMATKVFAATTHKSLAAEDEKEGSDRVDNVLGMIEEIKSYVESKKKATLSGFLHSVALTSEDDKNNDANNVSLMTIHSAKGLEFPVVYGVGIEKDILPHKRSVTEDNGIEEERRLFYVLVTRAKEELNLTSARIRNGKETKPSMFFEEAGLSNLYIQSWKKTVFIDSYEQPDYYSD